MAFTAFLDEHSGCDWSQIGPCVYCDTHNLRLYQGTLPDDKRRIPICAVHDWDEEMGQGFFFQCKVCKFIEWPED